MIAECLFSYRIWGIGADAGSFKSLGPLRWDGSIHHLRQLDLK
jgi:hypothetical protein